MHCEKWLWQMCLKLWGSYAKLPGTCRKTLSKHCILHEICWQCLHLSSGCAWLQVDACSSVHVVSSSSISLTISLVSTSPGSYSRSPAQYPIVIAGVSELPICSHICWSESDVGAGVNLCHIFQVSLLHTASYLGGSPSNCGGCYLFTEVWRCLDYWFSTIPHPSRFRSWIYQDLLDIALLVWCGQFSCVGSVYTVTMR